MATTSSPRNPSHLLVPVALLAVVMLMVVPLPPLLLDLLLSIDIGLSVVLLLTVVYVKQPVEFSVFPSLLLLLTLLRLALNVAATRLILMHGHEGVEAAGHAEASAAATSRGLTTRPAVASGRSTFKTNGGREGDGLPSRKSASARPMSF